MADLRIKAFDGGFLPLDWMLSVLHETPDKVRKMYVDGENDTVAYSVRLQELTRRKNKAAVLIGQSWRGCLRDDFSSYALCETKLP